MPSEVCVHKRRFELSQFALIWSRSSRGALRHCRPVSVGVLAATGYASGPADNAVVRFCIPSGTCRTRPTSSARCAHKACSCMKANGPDLGRASIGRMLPMALREPSPTRSSMLASLLRWGSCTQHNNSQRTQSRACSRIRPPRRSRGQPPRQHGGSMPAWRHAGAGATPDSSWGAETCAATGALFGSSALRMK